MNTLAKLWYWLTHHTDCGWCNKRLHRAWIPLPEKRIGGFIDPRVTSGMCPECFKNLQPVKINQLKPLKEAA